MFAVKINAFSHKIDNFFTGTGGSVYNILRLFRIISYCMCVCDRVRQNHVQMRGQQCQSEEHWVIATVVPTAHGVGVEKGLFLQIFFTFFPMFAVQ